MRLIIFNALFLWSCGYALWRGGRDERLCALIFIVARLGTLAAVWAGVHYLHVEAPIFWVDVAALAALGTLALRSKRFWPLWVTSMQLVEVLSHGVILIRPEVIPIAYRALTSFWSYPMMLTLIVATRRYRLRRMPHVADQYWPNSWLRPVLRMLRRLPIS